MSGNTSCCCFICVREMDAGVIENCGKFSRVATAGFSCLTCPFETVRGVVSLQVQSQTIHCETKTKDNVFVNVEVNVMYKVVPEKVVSAFYKLTNHKDQINSYVFDVIRSTVPRLELDHVFASKTEIANAVMNQLQHLMADYGYEILAALVTELTPESRVKFAMNEIVAQQRLRLAAAEKAEAEKILQIKAAEADAESKYLSGLGIARQRKAIVDGLRDTVSHFNVAIHGSTPSDVMDLLLMIQYFDLLKDINGPGKTGTSSLFLPHGPGSIKKLRETLRDTAERDVARAGVEK